VGKGGQDVLDEICCEHVVLGVRVVRSQAGKAQTDHMNLVLDSESTGMAPSSMMASGEQER